MKKTPTVIVTATEDAPVDMNTIENRLKDHAKLKVVPLPNINLTNDEEDQFINDMKDALVIFQRPGFITRNIIQSCTDLKYVITHGAGVDKIDLEACEENGVMVGNVPGGNANAVAEQVLAGIIVLLRKLHVANSCLHAGRWKEGRFVGGEISEGTFGIIGFGNIGKRLFQILSGFGTKTIIYDPYITKTENMTHNQPILYENLDELVKESDYISIHVPLTADTKNMLAKDQFQIMKKNCIVVNTARGGIIDESALCDCLQKGNIGGAVLDVFEKEPLQKQHPLTKFQNVLMSPHIGGSTRECLTRIAKMACEEIILFLSGQKPINLVSKSQYNIDLASRA